MQHATVKHSPAHNAEVGQADHSEGDATVGLHLSAWQDRPTRPLQAFDKSIIDEPLTED